MNTKILKKEKSLMIVNFSPLKNIQCCVYTVVNDYQK